VNGSGTAETTVGAGRDWDQHTGPSRQQLYNASQLTDKNQGTKSRRKTKDQSTNEND